MGKEEKKHLEKQCFPNSIERWRKWKVCFGDFWLFSVFVMLKARLSKHQLIKISTINTKSKRFTFAQKHSSGFIERRLDYMCILNILQEFVFMTEILLFQHIVLPYCSLFQIKEFLRGKRFWKFNSSLTKVQNYIIEIKNWFTVFVLQISLLSIVNLSGNSLKIY